MATPSLAMIPSAYADSKVYSVLPNNGDGDFTFNRDSSATRVGSNGLIQEVGFFGSELVNSWTNADFSSFASNGSNITQMVSSGSGNNCYSLATFTSGKTYELKFTSSQNITAQIRISPNTNLTSAQVVLSNPTSGFNSIIFTATSNYSHIGFFANSSFTDTQITEFISREIQGDQPRLNYDISNGVVQSCPSLLLEPASTNLITYSEAIGSNGFSLIGISIQSNVTTSPDGSTNADLNQEDTTNGSHFMFKDFNLLSGQTYTISVFAKKNGTNRNLRFGDGGIGWSSGFNVNFDLTNGTADSGAVIENYGNGWYRCSVNGTTSATTSRLIIYNLLNTSTSYQGDGTSGVYVWGFQIEQQSYATSYIPTLSGASQTRAAESCFGAGNAATFNSTEGVLYVEISALANDSTYRQISLSDGTATNRISIFYQNTSNQIAVESSGTSTNLGIYNQNLTITNVNKIALKYKANDCGLWINGVEVATDTSFASFSSGTLSKLSFNRGDVVQNFYGNTKDLRVYNEALTDAQLQTLTT